MSQSEQKQLQMLKVNRYEVEENAVFIDYNPEQILKTIDNYKNLNVYHRVSLSKNIQAIEDVLKDDSIVSKLMLFFAGDIEDIQRELLFYLKKLSKNQTRKNDWQKYLIQPLTRLINGIHLDVFLPLKKIKQKACGLLSEVSQHLSIKQKKEIIKFAISLHKSDEEENKIVSIQLFAKMTPDLPPQEAQKFFKTEYLDMYKQSSVRIKKEIVNSTCIIAKNVSKEFLNKDIIEQFYLQKCKETVWGVRKACVEILSQLVKMTDTKKEVLATCLQNFTKDGNKIVKIAAYKCIPQFIANYQSDKVPQKLVDIYIHLMDNEINQAVSRQNEIIIKVAFFFPGVVYTLGPNKWPQLKKLFTRLINFRHNDVRMPLASSLHEISKIIGPQNSKDYMFSALDTILKDNSDKLKLSAISHLSEFVEVFEQNTRENLIDVFLVLQKDPKKWRVRYEISHQLEKLSKIYEPQTIFKYIFPISLKLCNDNVTVVRDEAAQQMYFVIQNLKQSQMGFQQMAIESIKGFSLSEKFIQRQTFAKMIKKMYKLQHFKQKLMENVIEIAKDKVMIVRITLAISLRQIMKQKKQNAVVFAETIKILKKDVQDVRQYFIE